MYGLSVRWSLTEAPAEVDRALYEYVTQASLARFSQLPGLRMKTWRTRSGEWFEGTYVFDTAAARDGFAAEFAPVAAGSPGSQLIGCAPSIETFDVVAVAEGAAGFAAGPGPGPVT